MPPTASSTGSHIPRPRLDPEDGGLRHRLRSATAEAHARLDARLAAFDLASRSGYRCFLEANAAALLPLETALETSGVQRLFPDWDRRRRRMAMLDDLACLDGVARPLDTVVRLDDAGVIGAMYVLEGSRLGAKVLLRTVTQSPDPRVAAATAYLRHGEGQRLWQSFLPMLEEHAGRLDGEEAVADAARLAFDLFYHSAGLAPHPAPNVARPADL